MNGVFSPTQQPTLGVDFSLKELVVEGGILGTSHSVHVQLWDVAGQDRSRKVSKVSCQFLRKESICSTIIIP